MDVLTRFGLGSIESYTFDGDNQSEYQDNFGNPRQQNTQVVGKDGAIPVHGFGRSPMETGNVRISFFLFGNYATATGDLRTAVAKMESWGLRRLFKRHQNGKLMWTWASVSSEQSPQVVRRMPHLRQLVQMTFSCPDSKWYSRDGMLFLNDDLLFGDGETFPAVRVDRQSVMDGSTVSVTNGGSAPVSAYVRWDGDGTNSMVNPVLSRKNWLGRTVDTLTYTGTIGATDVVEIDARNKTTTTRANLTVQGGDWLTIPPGTWTLTVGMSSGQGLLTVDFWDGWWK